MKILDRLGLEARRLRAVSGGYFWLPCHLCGEYMGGNEWQDVDGKPSSIRCLESPSRGHGICQDCTAAGLGQHAEFRDDFVPQPCPYCARPF